MAGPQQIGNLFSQHQRSNEISNLPATSQLSSAALTLRSRYRTEAEFINTFSPNKQYSYCTEIRRCYMGKAPSLVTVKEAFGKGTAQSWLAFQLRDLSEFSGAKEKLGIGQVDDITEVIISQFAYLKVTELMHFFLLFKSGKFGKFYGVVDGLAIMEALREFIQERNEMVSRWQYEEEARRKSVEEAEQKREWALLSRRYSERVPDAFTDKAPINFLQYRLMGYDSMDDTALKREIKAIRDGDKKIPDDIISILEWVRAAFDKKN